MEDVKPEDVKTHGRPPALPSDYISTAQKHTLFGGQLLGCRKHPSSGKVVINPLFVDDTDQSNDEQALKEKQATPHHRNYARKDKDHYVTVFTISNGEVTFQRKGSQKWFTDGGTEGIQGQEEQRFQDIQLGNETSVPVHQVAQNSPDRKHVTSVSCSPERKYIPRSTSVSYSDDTGRRYDRDAILKKHSRGGRKTDYGFIDNNLGLTDSDGISMFDGILPPGSAMTDDEKVAAQISNGSLHGTTSPQIRLPHTHYQNSHHMHSKQGKWGKRSRRKKKSSQTKTIRKDVCEYRKVKACRLLGLTISMLIVVGLAVALVIYFAKKHMAF